MEKTHNTFLKTNLSSANWCQLGHRRPHQGLWPRLKSFAVHQTSSCWRTQSWCLIIWNSARTMTSMTWIRMMDRKFANDSSISWNVFAKFSKLIVIKDNTEVNSRKLTKFCTRRELFATWRRYSIQLKRVSHIYGSTERSMFSHMKFSMRVENYSTSSEWYNRWYVHYTSK